MSKRGRIDASNLPYGTNDGGKWLRKVLHPADINVEVSGMPDTATNARAVLNYQFQSEVPVPSPATYNENITAYDADLYVYQDPIVYGLAVSYPSGTLDIAGKTVSFSIKEFEPCTITIPDNCAPRTIKVILNDQIEGNTRYEKMQSLQKYCQRYRMIYGGVQGIPACSALYDSGTIEACQQVFSPANGNVSDLCSGAWGTKTANHADGVVVPHQIFQSTDFADSGNSIQNPASLYCRYKEGIYMPYKLRNPLVHNYKGSEQKAVTSAPYIVTGVCSYAFDSSLNTHEFFEWRYNATTRTFTSPKPNIGIEFFAFKCVNKLGVQFYLAYSPQGNVLDGNVTLPDASEIAGYTKATSAAPADGYWYTFQKLPFVGEIDSPYILPVGDVNIGVISFKSIGIQAAVRLVFRMGVEMMITAGGVYSPFKHKSPKYDELAINTYIKACHNLRDAFLGDAGSAEGGGEFGGRIGEIIMAGGAHLIGNQGSSWYGQVSI